MTYARSCSTYIFPSIPFSAERHIRRDLPPAGDGAEPLRLFDGGGVQGSAKVRRDGRKDARPQAVHPPGQRDRAKDQHRHERKSTTENGNALAKRETN